MIREVDNIMVLVGVLERKIGTLPSTYLGLPLGFRFKESCLGSNDGKSSEKVKSLRKLLCFRKVAV